MRGPSTVAIDLVLTLALALEPTGPPVAARDLPLTLVALTSPVHPGQDARLTVQTDPHTQCMMLVQYKSGGSITELPVPKRADDRGRVSWTWRIDPRATPGTWPIIVHCSDDFKGNVEQRRLDITFVVR
jgi:hypothetical protein